MHNIIFSPRSKKDLDDVRNYISENNPEISIHVVETIFLFINNLSLFPLIGKESEIDLGLRELIEPTFKYKIIYQFDGKDVYILAIYKRKKDS